MIEIENLWKQYRLGNTVDFNRNFREALTDWFRFSSKQNDRKLDQTFWALREIDLQIPSGKSLGLIGHNGAGKSTLLKVLSRITKPTYGKITLHGSVASLLEVGTGFHSELTGRENIYLYGSIMGMSKRDIKRRFEQIVDYAGTENFLDTPIKRYSSGMYVRLAFSVAAHVEPDILIVDEVLAVGDQAFREKCLGKMEDVAQSGRTVIFVSHNMASVATLCEQTAWLDQGKIMKVGSTNEIVSDYKNHNRQHFDAQHINSLMKGSLRDQVVIEELLINQQIGSYNVAIDVMQEIEITLTGSLKTTLDAANVSISLFYNDARLFTIYDVEEPSGMQAGQFKSHFVIPKNTLAANTYTLGIGVRTTQYGEWVWGQNVSEITITDSESDNIGANAVGVLKSLGIGYRT